MNKLKLIFISILLCASTNIYSDSIDNITNLSDSITSQIKNIKQSNNELLIELNLVKSDNELMKKLNQEDIKKIDELTTTIQNYNIKISKDQEKIRNLENKVSFYFKFTVIGCIFILLFILVRLLTFILKCKGINLPEIIDEIL